MDWSLLFKDITVAGMPLMGIVLGLVQWFKGFPQITGIWTRVLSMLVGLLLGVGYELSVAMPTGFSGWFTVGVFGIGLGLVASGVFDTATAVVQSAQASK